MKKINWRLVSFAFWIEVILSYVLPFQVVDGFRYKVGFPMPFISVYKTDFGINPLMSMNLNPLALLVNGVIIYALLSVCIKAYHKFKRSRT